MNTNIVAIQLMAALLSACTTSDFGSRVSSGSAVSISKTKLAKTNKDEVRLYYRNNILPKKYKVIGYVSVNHASSTINPSSEISIADELKHQAAKIGGNGVINITSGLDRTNGDAVIYWK